MSAVHHRFGVGDGLVIASVGAAPVLPEVTITAAITSSDQF